MKRNPVCDFDTLIIVFGLLALGAAATIYYGYMPTEYVPWVPYGVLGFVALSVLYSLVHLIVRQVQEGRARKAAKDGTKLTPESPAPQLVSLNDRIVTILTTKGDMNTAGLVATLGVPDDSTPKQFTAKVRNLAYDMVNQNRIIMVRRGYFGVPHKQNTFVSVS